MKLLIQTAAALLVAAVAFATLGPPRYRPMTHLGQTGEHALAFVLVGLAVGIAFPRRPWLTAVIAVILTGGVELLQNFAPGRYARWSDFVVDALALSAGLAMAFVASKIWDRRHAGTN